MMASDISEGQNPRLTEDSKLVTVKSVNAPFIHHGFSSMNLKCCKKCTGGSSDFKNYERRHSLWSG